MQGIRGWESERRPADLPQVLHEATGVVKSLVRLQVGSLLREVDLLRETDRQRERERERETEREHVDTYTLQSFQTDATKQGKRTTCRQLGVSIHEVDLPVLQDRQGQGGSRDLQEDRDGAIPGPGCCDPMAQGRGIQARGRVETEIEAGREVHPWEMRASRTSYCVNV